MAFATTWGLMSFATSSLLPVWAQSSSFINNPVQQSLLPLPLAQHNSNASEPDFSGDGRSGERGSGGSRGNCPALVESDSSLTALIPVSNWGTTVAERPTLWFYVPYTPEQAAIGEFILQDEDLNNIFRANLNLPKTPGFVSVTIPATQNPLEINKWYRWNFKLYCDSSKFDRPTYAFGWVKRIALTPALERQLKVAGQRKDKVYAVEEIWFDALDYLTNLRLANPTDASLEKDWNHLLGAKGVVLTLPNQVPISGSVTLNPVAEE